MMKKISLLVVLALLMACNKNESPSCIITSPSENDIFTLGDTILISADANDPDGTISEVRFYINDIGLESFETFPYNYSLPTKEYETGTHTLKVTARDNEGLEASDEVQFIIEADLPTVNTSDISTITESSALCGGDVIGNGGAEITAKGVCWSTSQNPTISDSYTSDGNGLGSFTSTISELICETTYYVKAYATNSVGTAYGDEKIFTTADCYIVVTDYDGNTYQTVKIGEQRWMAQNLKVTHYADGTPIPLIEEASSWENQDTNEKAYCWYNNNVVYGNNYGALYNWAAAMNGNESSDSNPSQIQGVCPSGWHIPSHSEFKQLEIFLGMSQIDADNTGWRGTNEGGMLKSSGTEHWDTPNTGADNSSGFSAFPGGYRIIDGSYLNMGSYAIFWSATEGNSTHAWYRHLINDKATSGSNYYDKRAGMSVRCVMD